MNIDTYECPSCNRVISEDEYAELKTRKLPCPRCNYALVNEYKWVPKQMVTVGEIDSSDDVVARNDVSEKWKVEG